MQVGVLGSSSRVRRQPIGCGRRRTAQIEGGGARRGWTAVGLATHGRALLQTHPGGHLGQVGGLLLGTRAWNVSQQQRLLLALAVVLLA